MNDEPNRIGALEQRIQQLEEQLAFQEDNLEQFQIELLAQQKDQENLRFQLQQLLNKLREFQPSQIAPMSEETPPPHY